MIRQLAEKHFERGRRFELQAQWAEAEAAYRQACALQPDFPGPYFALARIEAGRGQHEAALALIETALTMDHDLEMIEWRAYVRGRLRRYEEALDDYREVAKEGDPQVLVNLGRMLLALGRYDEAQATLEGSGDASAKPLIDALPRYREYRGADRVDDARAVRYLFARTAVLGTLGDGGTNLANTRYLLLTPRHLVVTVGRFVRLAAQRGWTFDGVVGGGAHHGPIAAMVAECLGCPLVDRPSPGARVLVCSGVLNGLSEARERVRPWRAAGAAMQLAAGFVASGDPDLDEPELVGFVGRAAVPWYRVEPFSRLQPDEGGGDSEWPGFKVGPAVIDPNIGRVKEALLAAWRARGSDDPYADPVLEYYTRRHADLRAFEWGAK